MGHLALGGYMRNFAFLAALSLASCGTYQELNAPTAQNFNTLSFETVRETVLRPKCFECHSDARGNKGHVNLERLADVRAALPDILSDLGTDKMPKDRDSLSPELKALVAAWSEAGAPEKSTLPLPSKPMPLPSITPGFDQVRDKIFSPYCIRCHNFLSDPAKVIRSVGKIQASIESDQMPKAVKPLSPRLKKLLADWIGAGLPMGGEEVRQKILIPYCVRCHGGFVNGETVSKRAFSIWSAVMSDEMPRAGDPLPDDLKKILDQWFKTGAAN